MKFNNFFSQQKSKLFFADGGCINAIELISLDSFNNFFIFLPNDEKFRFVVQLESNQNSDRPLENWTMQSITGQLEYSITTGM